MHMCSCSVLDFWVKGSGLTAISLYVKDSATKTLSKDVRFQRADLLPEGVKILQNDDMGFIHVTVALSYLRSASSCGGGVLAHFDRIIFADISGMGFTLVLDDIKLASKNVIEASSFFVPAGPTRAPVFGEDLPGLRAGKNR